jgi:phosphatidyl-myo-inositol dimannoside synthase
MILGVFTEALGNGGVQRVGRHICATVASFSSEQGERYQFLSLNDPIGTLDLKVGDIRFQLKGFGRRKINFVLSILAAARKTRIAILGHPNLAAFGIVFKILRPPVRYSVVTYGTDIWFRQPLLTSYGFSSAHRITALTKFTAGKITELYKIPQTKIVCLPPALDPDFSAFNPSSTPSVLPYPRVPILLTVARLAKSEDKGVDKVITALPAILAEQPESRYIVVGQGDDLPRLQRLAMTTGVADHVLFEDRASDNEVRQYYAACDVYVMPSRLEGFGIAFIEAMALGKPVIGGRHGGTPDLVEEGVNGFLVDHSDVKTLARRIIELLRDKTLRLRMGEAGRNCVGENYTFEHFRQRLMSVLTNSEPGPIAFSDLRSSPALQRAE